MEKLVWKCQWKFCRRPSIDHTFQNETWSETLKNWVKRLVSPLPGPQRCVSIPRASHSPNSAPSLDANSQRPPGLSQWARGRRRQCHQLVPSPVHRRGSRTILQESQLQGRHPSYTVRLLPRQVEWRREAFPLRCDSPVEEAGDRTELRSGPPCGLPALLLQIARRWVCGATQPQEAVRTALQPASRQPLWGPLQGVPFQLPVFARQAQLYAAEHAFERSASEWHLWTNFLMQRLTVSKPVASGIRERHRPPTIQKSKTHIWWREGNKDFEIDGSNISSQPIFIQSWKCEAKTQLTAFDFVQWKNDSNLPDSFLFIFFIFLLFLFLCFPMLFLILFFFFLFFSTSFLLF